MTTVTVEDTTARSSFSENLLRDDDTIEDSLETAVLKVIKKDPFISIREIKKELLSLRTPIRAGWWQIFGLLKKNKLLTKKSRFRYVRRFF